MGTDLREHNRATDALPSMERARHHIKQQLGSAQVAIINRREHPSYGYTKSSIKTQLDRAEGMIALVSALERNPERSIHHIFAPLPEGDPLVENLIDLRRQLKEAK